jgi:hypothetical protein
LTLIGLQRSGKTSLAYALEDYSCRTNLVEEFFLGVDNDPNSAGNKNNDDARESKFFEINDFFFELADQPGRQDTIPVIATPASKRSSAKSVSGNSRSLSSLSQRIDLIAPAEKPDTVVCPVHIYDFNYHDERVCHLLNSFIDKHSVLLLCLDCQRLLELFSDSNEYASSNLEYKTQLFNLLDSLTLRMSKHVSYAILPVITKSDLIEETEDLNELLVKTRAMLDNYVNTKLTEISLEIKKIESLPKINASQSDRLKQLIQMRTFIEPYIYKTCLAVSSLKGDGIEELSGTVEAIIKENPKKNYQLIQNKVPTFWLEVEKYVASHLAELPSIKNENGNIRIINNSSHELDISILCFDANMYKEKLVKKFGMRHMVDQILINMSSCGKILWFHDNERLKSKIFFRPGVLFDLFFVLFRSNFDQNFTDATTHSIRTKLIPPNSKMLHKDNFENLKDDFINRGINFFRNSSQILNCFLIYFFYETGILHIDLLKMLWFPVLIVNSVKIIREISLLFMEFFMSFYPLLPKDKLKNLLYNYSKLKTDINPEFQDDSQSSLKLTMKDLNDYSELNVFIVPYFLPESNEEFVIRTQGKLEVDCQNAFSNGLALSFFVNSENGTPLPKLVNKYTFATGKTIIKSVFNKFATNCILNSDLYYKAHFNNVIYANNEDNSVG